MKRNLLGMCLVALLACAGTASADVLAEDSAANYTAETFVSGANLGSGFGEWVFWNAWPTLADSSTGECGNLNSGNGLSFRFARDAGADYCNGYRGFNALKPGDVLTFKFTCAWCAGGRGLDLFANGGRSDADKVANVINLSGDNLFSVNGTVIASNYAPHAVTEVTITQEADGIQLALKRTSADEGIDDLEYTTTIETASKLTGIGLYAGGWDWGDGANVENFAFYVNDLKIEGEPPADSLSLAGPWNVTSKEAELAFTVTRQNSEGTLDVALVSSYPEFASVPNLVTIADGDTEVSFTVTATLQGRGNVATISASAEGVTGASFEVKGPNYRVNNGSETPVSFLAGESADIWINWDGGARDDSKLALTAEPEDVISVPADWTLPAEGDVYVQSSVTALAPGDAALVLSYDGVEMARCNFSVLSLGLELSGPATAKTGTPSTFTVKGTLDGEEDGCTVTVDPAEGVTVDPASFDLTELGEDGFYYQYVEVTFANPGDYTIAVKSLNYEAAPLSVSVSEPADFSGYVAYDDASLYGDKFDFESTGVGIDGFGPWGIYKDSAEFGGAFVGGDAGGFPAILTEGKTMAIYANGSNPDYAIYRPFATDSDTGRPKDLQPGQKASVEFVVPESSGTLYVQFSRVWDGVPYKRCEVYASDYHVGVNVALGNDQEQKTELNWSANPRRIAVSLQRAADGSDYTLNLAGYNEAGELEDIFQHVVDADVGEWYDGIQGIVIGAYNMGGGENMPFNKLAITQEEEPVKVRTIGIMGTWNMDATGDYKFAVGPSEAGDPIGTVALAVTPNDGRVVLSAASVEVPGDDVAAFTVTVTSIPGEGEPEVTYTITATPADEAIPPAEFKLTPTTAYLSLTSENWEHTTDETEIWLCLRASPSFYGTYAITSEDAAVLAVPDASASIDLNEGQTEAWFNVTIEGIGQAHIYATMGETVRDYGFTINPGADPDVEIPAPAYVKGQGLSWDASILDNGFVLRGTDTLSESPDKDSWTDLVEGTDYVVKDGQVVVLYSSAYNYIALLKK